MCKGCKVVMKGVIVFGVLIVLDGHSYLSEVSVALALSLLISCAENILPPSYPCSSLSAPLFRAPTLPLYLE